MQVHLQSLVDIHGKQIFHSGKVVLFKEGVKSVVVGKPVGKLNINGREPRLHQLQIDQQAPGTFPSAHRILTLRSEIPHFSSACLTEINIRITSNHR